MGAGAKLEHERWEGGLPPHPPPRGGGAAPRFFRTQLPQSAVVICIFMNNLKINTPTWGMLSEGRKLRLLTKTESRTVADVKLF